MGCGAPVCAPLLCMYCPPPSMPRHFHSCRCADFVQIYNELETEFAVHNGPRWTKNGWDTDRYTINGRSWGTLEGLEMNVGEK